MMPIAHSYPYRLPPADAKRSRRRQNDHRRKDGVQNGDLERGDGDGEVTLAASYRREIKAWGVAVCDVVCKIQVRETVMREGHQACSKRSYENRLLFTGQ